jgi:heme-degrading monooxygenase HmoA
MTGQPYTSGTWLVQPGREDEFIARWIAFTSWSRENAPGAETFLLLRNAAAPDRFISFGAWDGDASIAAWKMRPEFGKHFAACRELCADFEGVDYTLAAAVGVPDQVAR